MEELKQCPFCGVKKTCIRRKLGMYYIHCESCGSSTGYWFTIDQAIESWNTRADKTCKAEQIPYMPGCYEGYWCSVCHCIEFESGDPNYCPHCGAKVVE